MTLGAVFWGSGGRAENRDAFCGDRAVSLLRLLDPETAHKVTVMALKYGFGPINESTKTDVLSVRLGENVSELRRDGCGFDKQGEVMDPLLRLGFGFVEIGGCDTSSSRWKFETSNVSTSRIEP